MLDWSLFVLVKEGPDQNFQHSEDDTLKCIFGHFSIGIAINCIFMMNYKLALFPVRVWFCQKHHQNTEC